MHGIKYSTFINGLKKVNLNLNRKVLADLAAQEPESFKEIVTKKLELVKTNSRMKDYDQLFQSALIDVEKSEDLKNFEEFRVRYFGKNGIISKELKSLSSLSEEDKKKSGKQLNTFKSNFFNSINKKIDLEQQLIDQQLKSEFIDSSLPTRESRDVQAKLHPISFTINEIYSILNEMGLSYEEGPDVENDFYNFTALNIPKNHPARQMHDTFYLESIDKKIMF